MEPYGAMFVCQLLQTRSLKTDRGAQEFRKLSCWDTRSLSGQEKLEKTFKGDEFEFAEYIYNIDTYKPPKRKETSISGELGVMTFEKTLELHGNTGACHARGEDQDALSEDFFHRDPKHG